MNLTLQVLANYLEEFLQVSLFSDYCPNGIQVEGKSDIKKIGLAVSASLETIEKARDKISMLSLFIMVFFGIKTPIL